MTEIKEFTQFYNVKYFIVGFRPKKGTKMFYNDGVWNENPDIRCGFWEEFNAERKLEEVKKIFSLKDFRIEKVTMCYKTETEYKIKRLWKSGVKKDGYQK